MSSLIQSEEDFKKTMEAMVKMTREIFDSDKEHSHMIFLISKDDPRMLVLLFDQVAKEVMKETKRGEPLAHADRDRTFNAIAAMAYQTRSLGYIEIAEGWALSTNVEKDDPKVTEKVLENYRKALTEHKFIQNMPVKMEVLTIRGRFRNVMGMSAWKIRRQGEAVWLEPMYKDGPGLDFMPYQKDEHTRASVIDTAIDKVIEEASA